MALLAAGCVGDTVAPAPAIDLSQLYWKLEMSHHAVNLSTFAPYDTFRLTATPYTASGEVLTNLPTPIFTTSDLERVQVSQDGLVRTLKAGSRIEVVALLSFGNVTHADTAVITVTAESPPRTPAAFSIHPVSPDSAKFAVSTSSGATLSVRATDHEGDSISALAVYFASSDPTTASIDRSTGQIFGVHPGPVTFYASTTAYDGITTADTLPFMIGLPLQLQVNVRTRTNADGSRANVFDPSEVVIGTGGTITWVNTTGLLTDVVFDDPANVARVDEFCVPPYSILAPDFCGAGSIEAFGAPPADPSKALIATTRYRRFPVPGTYTFRSTQFGTAGTITVVDESQP